jgi:2'-5' RNA ligase
VPGARVPLGGSGQAGAVSPLIVTLVLHPDDSARFDALRRTHFPPERNHLSAHVTLFHALPGEQLDRVGADLADVARVPAYDVRVTRVRSLGRGVAYDLRSPELDAQHRELANRWAPWLTRQDRQPLAAHVTVQNKVPPEAARALLAELSRGFEPYAVRARGLALWRYLGGPWEPVAGWDLDRPG